MPDRRPLASVLLALLVVIAAFAVLDYIARHGLPQQGGPIRGGPGYWGTERGEPPPSTIRLPFGLP
jgi:hypothetical protein